MEDAIKISKHVLTFKDRKRRKAFRVWRGHQCNMHACDLEFNFCGQLFNPFHFPFSNAK